ncbi:hypothetical protein [Nocardia sp. NPDC059228]|uniref:hypothetical protein n=1 Tax=Nocardia sp. NPDC059228 TaxID=3346777 RepID=UPI0036C698BB
MSDLFGSLPPFAGGPALPPVSPAAPEPPAAPATEAFPEGYLPGDYEPRASIAAPSNFTSARPGMRTTLWGDPERREALWGPLSATDAVLGADPTEIRTTTTENE